MHEFEQSETLKPTIPAAELSESAELTSQQSTRFAEWRTAPVVEESVWQKNLAAWKSLPTLVQASFGFWAAVGLALPWFLNVDVPIGFAVFMLALYADLLVLGRIKPKALEVEDQFGELDPESHLVSMGLFRNGTPYAGDTGVFRLSEGVFHFQGVATEFSFDAGCVLPDVQVTPTLPSVPHKKKITQITMDFPQVSLKVGEDVITVFLGTPRVDSIHVGLAEAKALKPAVDGWAKSCKHRVAINVLPPLSSHKVDATGAGRHILLKVKILAVICILSGIAQYVHVVMNPASTTADQHFQMSMAACSILMGLSQFVGLALGTVIGKRRVKKITPEEG